MDKNFKAAFLLRQVAFTVKTAIKTLYRKADDLFEKKEFKDYIDCIDNIQSEDITDEILGALDTANEAFKLGDYESVGKLLGSINTDLCKS